MSLPTALLEEAVRVTVEAIAWWGAFNNYVDLILSNFDPNPPRVDKNGHFTYFLPFVM